MISLKSNGHGLLRGDFEDRYGQKCSIQESSLATENTIWLGVDVNLRGQEVSARMLLTREHAKALIPLLRYFARNGSLAAYDPKLPFQVGQPVIGIGETNRGVEGRIVEVVPGQYITVQDDHNRPPEGQIICLWDNALLVWEERETVEGLSVYDRLLQEESV
jgi:hypothetical protein